MSQRDRPPRHRHRTLRLRRVPDRARCHRRRTAPRHGRDLPRPVGPSAHHLPPASPDEGASCRADPPNEVMDRGGGAVSSGGGPTDHVDRCDPCGTDTPSSHPGAADRSGARGAQHQASAVRSCHAGLTCGRSRWHAATERSRPGRRSRGGWPSALIGTLLVVAVGTCGRTGRRRTRPAASRAARASGRAELLRSVGPGGLPP
jgi:hypothetical protein